MRNGQWHHIKSKCTTFFTHIWGLPECWYKSYVESTRAFRMDLFNNSRHGARAVYTVDPHEEGVGATWVHSV